MFLSDIDLSVGRVVIDVIKFCDDDIWSVFWIEGRKYNLGG